MNEVSHLQSRIAEITKDHLPFLIDAYGGITESDTHGRPLGKNESIYEPGLIDSNAAVVFAYAAGRTPGARRDLGSLAQRALRRVAECDPESVPPLAWSYVAYALLLGDESRTGRAAQGRRSRAEQQIVARLAAGVASCAERLLDYVFPTGLYADTKAEETCWTAGPLVGAQALCPDDPRLDAWREKAHRFFLNSYNREADRGSSTVVEDKPLGERVSTANLFDDFTLENHGAFHPSYQACINNYAIPYLIYRDYLGRIPESLTWNWRGVHGVMQRLLRPNGRIFCPAGTDYSPYSHAEQIHYLALIVDSLGDPLALRATERAVARIRKFQAHEAGRLVGGSLGGGRHLYWEYHFASFVVFAHALLRACAIVPADSIAAARIGGGPWSSAYARSVTLHLVTGRFNGTRDGSGGTTRSSRVADRRFARPPFRLDSFGFAY